MATREGIGGGLEGLDRFDALTQEIEEKFSHFHSLLETQRVSLLERVKKMRELYQQHQELSEAIHQVEEVKGSTIKLKSNLITGNKDDILKIWNDQIAELKRNKSNLDQGYTLKFVENSEEFSDCVKRMHLREIETVEYSKRRVPIVMKGKRGFGGVDFWNPQSISSIGDTIDEVFVIDYHKNLANVYSFEGDFLREFGKGRLNGPYGICLSGEFLFVSSNSSSVISKFAKTGEFVKSTSLEGENAIQLKSPKGLCVHNEFVYICNFGHNRIEVLKLDLTFVKNFGEDKLKYPEDIKQFNNQIFVLVQLNSTIHTFNTEHNYLRSIHFTGLQSQIPNAYFFTIDNKGNFIVSDRNAGCLKIFNPSGEYEEILGEGYLLIPQGVTMDDQQRIVIICKSSYNCFQAY